VSVNRVLTPIALSNPAAICLCQRRLIGFYATVDGMMRV